MSITDNHSPYTPDKPTLLWEYPIEEDIQDSKLAAQRNWISKNPIVVSRDISNCYKATQPLVRDIDQNLVPLLDHKMQPQNYGTAIQCINVCCAFSYFDNSSCKCNYVTFDEPTTIKSADLQSRLTAMYSESQISDNEYWAQNKFEFGRFQRSSGMYKVTIYFSKEFSEQPLTKQRESFGIDIERAVSAAVLKLKKKKLQYDLDRMRSEFKGLLDSWLAR